MPVEGAAGGIRPLPSGTTRCSDVTPSGVFCCGVAVEGGWRSGVGEYDGMEGIAWDWQSVDGAMVKAPLAIECVGANPTDRGKKRAQAKFTSRRAWRPAIARRERGQRA